MWILENIYMLGSTGLVKEQFLEFLPSVMGLLGVSTFLAKWMRGDVEHTLWYQSDVGAHQEQTIFF